MRGLEPGQHSWRTDEWDACCRLKWGASQKARGAEGSPLLRHLSPQSHVESFFNGICAYFKSYRHKILACPL